MSRQEVYAAGVRLIGVYFAVIAFTGVVALVAGLFVAFPGSGFPATAFNFSLKVLVITLARPLAHVLVAFVMIRKTDWCLKRIGIEAESTEAGAA